jgi:enoyl-CoA hydratase/carnithine racemase
MADECLAVALDARGVYTLTLNDPERYNVLSAAMIAALDAALARVAADAAARVVVIAATGKAFCAGHDLNEMLGMAGPERDAHGIDRAGMARWRALFEACSKMMLRIHRLRVPVIAQVQGVATAAGCQLVAQCDLAYASEAARFATSGINLGLFCATPSVPLLRKMPLKSAMELLLTGDFWGAQEAAAQGLVNRVFAADALAAGVAQVVESVLRKPPEALALGKELAYAQAGLGIEAAYERAAHTMALNMAMPSAHAGVAGFVKR